MTEREKLMPDTPTPSGAMLVWEEDEYGARAPTPFPGLSYDIFRDCGGFVGGLRHRDGHLDFIGPDDPFPDLPTARTACETDCRERIGAWARAAGWVEAGDTFQDRVQPWMMACFGAEISADRVERGDRLLEEVLELLQSGGYDPARVLALRDYVWSREAGEPAQEAGGAMVTLAAYCLAHDLNMHDAGETELARIWTKVEKIRAKQAAKPTGSALPVALVSTPLAPATPSVSAEAVRAEIAWHEAEKEVCDGYAEACSPRPESGRGAVDNSADEIARKLTPAQAKVLEALRCGLTLRPGRNSRRFNANAAASLLKWGLVHGYAHGWAITLAGRVVADAREREAGR